VPDTVLNDKFPCRTDEPAGLPGHHVPDVPDHRDLCKVDICIVELFCDEVGDPGGAHLLVTIRQAVDLLVRDLAGLADVVVDDECVFLFEALCRKEVLLAGAEIGEDLEGIVVRHLRHGERFELADKDRADGNTLP